jgi:hypothetical protein
VDEDTLTGRDFGRAICHTVSCRSVRDHGHSLQKVGALYYRNKVLFDAVAKLGVSVVLGEACDEVSPLELRAVDAISLDATNE